MPRRAVFIALIGLGVCLTARAADFYVSPTASASGTGSLGNPWRLQTALNHPAAVQPGDTIWLRGGTYSGAFVSSLIGSSTAPIIVRQYPGERAIIDGNGGGAYTLEVNGAWTTYWGFEVTNSNPNRSDSLRYTGVDVHAPNSKFINMIVHDASGQGFGTWSDAPDSEIYGCLVYYNGSNQLDHGIYAQNQSGQKKFLDNILFHNNGFGFHIYTSGGRIDNMHLEGNTVFNSGFLEPGFNGKANILLGASGANATSCTSSPQVAQDPGIINNSTYHKRTGGGREVDLGYGVGSCDPTMTGNYLVGDTTLTLAPVFGSINISGNTFYGPISGFSQSTYPSNTYLSSRPTGTRITIRPNQYEAGRAHITIYNWDLLNTVNVNLSSLLSPGSYFEIRNAADYFAAPVVSGVYDGSLVPIPMTGLSVATPVGYSAPEPTGPEFNAFVLTMTLGPGEFFDVPLSHIFHEEIHTIALLGITTGCAPGFFCPADPVTRASMAVFLLRSLLGAAYVPPNPTGAVFADVPANSFAAAYIEDLYARGITSGCGTAPLRYCPNDAVTRAQMAILLLRTLLGAGYVPPAPTGTVFADVPAGAFAAGFIEDLYARGITSGCAVGPLRYCPNAANTRGEMAVFLVRTFNLQ